ncbi:MAG: GntR family transcriptional regulator [Lachnospiraceae bacterium]|nr:GntR family transcriptional regulator [Lachnospiraceae bacterium]
MIIIDYKDSRPIYEQVVEKFKLLILKGVLKEDDKMPSVRSLAVDLSINPNTIQKAYGVLEQQGYIYTVKGRGNFVAQKPELLQERKEDIKNRLKDLVVEGREIGIESDQFENWLREFKG